MLFSMVVLADTGSIWVLLAFGAILAIAFLIAAILLESLVLKLLKWNSYWRSLWASFLMNLASALVGIPLTLLLINAEPVVYLPIAWGVSVIVEGGVLVLMKRDGGRQNWTAAIVANLASYALLVVPLLTLLSL